jgi:uncharacterized protein YodC (DUF2158 family)
LKIGDIVRLKSGGPSMTVNRVGTADAVKHERPGLVAGEVEAIWFRGENATDVWADSNVFNISTLEKVDADG